MHEEEEAIEISNQIMPMDYDLGEAGEKGKSNYDGPDDDVFDDAVQREEFNTLNEAILGLDDIGLDDGMSSDCEDETFFENSGDDDNVDDDYEDYPEEEMDDY